MVSAAGEVFLKGTQYSRDYLKNPPRDFLDKVEIATGKKTRVFDAATDVAESMGTLLDDDGTLAVVTRESPTTVPNSFLKDLKAGTLTQLTKNVDPAPEFTALTRKRVEVTRPDGIKFVVQVTLPADYQAGTRLPGMFWFYPYEYTDQAGYDRTLRTENVQVPRVGAAHHRVPGHAGLRGGQLRSADHWRGQSDERQLHLRPAHEPLRRHRRARPAGLHRPHAGSGSAGTATARSAR